MRFDLVVIGGGLAGLTAAAAAARRGLEVAVVRRGLGTTAMSSGALDFPAELPGLFGAGRPVRPVRPVGGAGPGGAAGSVGPRQPEDEAQDAGSVFDARDVREAFETFRGWLAEAGVRLEGEPGEGMLLLDTGGCVRRTDLAFPSAAAGRLDRWPGRAAGSGGADEGGAGKLLFLGVRGYAPFRPEWVARRVAAAGLIDPGRVAAGWVALPGPLGEEADLSALRIARTLDDSATLEDFARLVAAEARRAGASMVAMPPVLGLERAEEVRAALAADGTVVFELLSPPPSLPGQRLQGILDRLARGAGAVVISGTVKGLRREGRGGEGRIGAVSVEAHGRSFEVGAAEFVLAAGRFAAGGLSAADGRLKEPVFGLAVYAPAPPGWPPDGVPAGRRLVTDMVYERFRAGHPVFEAGLAVDAELRPLGADGGAPFSNLRAAGSIIGGWNHFADGAGSGVAVVTGIRAGRLAAKAVLRGPGRLRPGAGSAEGRPRPDAQGREGGTGR